MSFLSGISNAIGLTQGNPTGIVNSITGMLGGPQTVAGAGGTAIAGYFYRAIVILTGFIFLTAGLFMFSKPIEVTIDKPSNFRKRKH